MAAPVFPIEVNAGTTSVTLIAWQVNGVSTPITGNLFHCEVRDRWMKPGTPILFTVDWQEIVTDGQGLTALVFTPAQTEKMTRRAYSYIVNMTDPTGFVRRILEGPIGVTQ